MPARANGECGIKNGSWCLSGKDLAGSPGNDYYALCAVVASTTRLHSVAGYNIYKVPVPHGQLLVEGKVAETCENTGMKAVCYGDASCSYTRQANSRCVTTENNLGCGTVGSKNTLAKAICGDSDPKKCPDLWGTFSYMPDRPLGECGIGNQSMCIDGKNLAASPGNTYYAICATEIASTTLLLAGRESNIYKVPVPHGQLLTEGKVPETCENAGMKALCWGDASCSYTKKANSRCVTTPHHLACGNIDNRNTLAKAICGNSDPRKCPDLWGTFSYMPARANGECGIKNGSWCLKGKDFAGSPGNDYYALCAVVGELPDFDSIPSN